MTVPDGMAYYSSYHKFMVGFIFIAKEEQALRVLCADESPVDSLWRCPDEYVIPTPFSNMKIVLATFEAEVSATAAIATIQQQLFWNGITLEAAPFESKELETSYLGFFEIAEEMTGS